MTRAELVASRLDWAEAQLRDCRLCPRQCRVNRREGNVGWCRAQADVHYFMEFVNYSEEPELSPSHALCLNGCNLKCAFCHTAPVEQTNAAKLLTTASLEGLVSRGLQQGARNLNIYGGEPTVSLPGVLHVLADAGPLPPIVWNTNLYCTDDALDMVGGIPEMFLVDMKFGKNDCANAVADAPGYWDTVRARLTELARSQSGNVLVRHLILPGHAECCTQSVLTWLAGVTPPVRVSLRTGYLVMPSARGDSRLGRFLTTDEASRAQTLARKLGLTLADTDLASRPTQDEAAGAGQDGPPPTPRTVDAEIVLSPDGRVYLRNAPQTVTELVQDVAGRPHDAKEGDE